MVPNHAVTCSSFTYGKNAGTSKLLVELITIVNKACKTAHFYDMIFIYRIYQPKDIPPSASWGATEIFEVVGHDS